MPIYLGTTPITKIYKGSVEVTDSYLGTTQKYTSGTKIWVYLGTSGTYDIAHIADPVALCKSANTTYTKNSLEAAFPAANYAIGHKARVQVFDTVEPIPNDCGFDFFEVQFE